MWTCQCLRCYRVAKASENYPLMWKHKITGRSSCIFEKTQKFQVFKTCLSLDFLSNSKSFGHFPLSFSENPSSQLENTSTPTRLHFVLPRVASCSRSPRRTPPQPSTAFVHTKPSHLTLPPCWPPRRSIYWPLQHHLGLKSSPTPRLAPPPPPT